jgi:hypothetical protein
MMKNFEKLYSTELVHALVDAGGTITDVSRAFERGYSHISQTMLSIAGYPALGAEQARKLFDALHSMADVAFSFSELDYLLIPFNRGKSLIERSGVRRRGPHRRFRSIFSLAKFEFDQDVIMIEQNERVFVVANAASERSRALYPDGAYISSNSMTHSEMRDISHLDVIDGRKFTPISQFLDGKSETETTYLIEALSFAMDFVERDRKSFERWILNPLGGLPDVVAFHRDRLKTKKRRPFLIARHRNLSHGRCDVFSYRKPIMETIDRLDRVCREYKPPHWKDLKTKRDEIIDGEIIFNSLLFNASFLFARFAMATSKYGDRVPIGWGLKSPE